MTCSSLLIPLRTMVRGSFSNSSWTCARTNGTGESAAAEAAPTPSSRTISLRDKAVMNSSLDVHF